ncbi:MAG TPA: ABC transporter permease [Steroidobacteraceae bacterium]|nr:ABC transporter permease [Steroidobacteraceae bacterium]
MSAIMRIVMQKELRESLRDRRTLLTSLVLGPVYAPLFFILVLKLALARQVAAQDEAVPVTVSNAATAPNFVQSLREAGLTVTLRDGDDAEIRRWIADGNGLVVLAVPSSFGERFTAGQPAAIMLYADGADSQAERHAARARQAIASYAATLAALRLQARGISPNVVQPIVVDTVDVSTPSARATLLLGMLSYVILVVTLLGGLYLAIDATAGERERGSLEALLTVPARREQLIWGKIAASALMMSVALALVTVSVAIALELVPLETFGMSANFGPDVAWRVFLAVLPFALVGAALLTVVASFTRTYKEAQSWLGVVMLVPTLPIAIAGVLDVQPQASLMMVPSLSQHLVIQALMRGDPLPGAWVALSVGATLALGLLLAWLAGNLYRRESILGG